MKKWKKILEQWKVVVNLVKIIKVSEKIEEMHRIFLKNIF